MPSSRDLIMFWSCSLLIVMEILCNLKMSSIVNFSSLQYNEVEGCKCNNSGNFFSASQVTKLTKLNITSNVPMAMTINFKCTNFRNLRTGMLCLLLLLLPRYGFLLIAKVAGHHQLNFKTGDPGKISYHHDAWNF